MAGTTLWRYPKPIALHAPELGAADYIRMRERGGVKAGGSALLSFLAVEWARGSARGSADPSHMAGSAANVSEAHPSEQPAPA